MKNRRAGKFESGCKGCADCDCKKDESPKELYPMYTSKILKVIEENYKVKTFEIDHELIRTYPGQFIMVWVPGVGERPMSIGNNMPLTISVAKVGDVSGKIHELKKGDVISYRGPFGKGFTPPQPKKQNPEHETQNPLAAIEGKRILVIGGGYGVVTMFFLAKRAKEMGMETIAVIGGRSVQDIIYEKHLFGVCKAVFVTTDDGSKGRKGNVMSEAEALIESKNFDMVYCCGPERMMEAVANLCRMHKIPCQVSIERYMKCGVGVCGSCAIDGKLTCIDGPVFSGEVALAMKEFGKPHRDASGKSKE